MKGLIDLLTLLIGVMIWQYLKPQLGYGGLVIGGIAAFLLRMAILRLFVTPTPPTNNPAKTEDIQHTPTDVDETSTKAPEVTESKE